MEKLIYENALSCKEGVADFILEGRAAISFADGAMYMENRLGADQGQRANYVFWCPEVFPKDIRIEWEFKPLSDIGLCILFFAARGRGGEDIFDPSLRVRTGEYPQYHSGDIDTFHVSYFRRKEADERAFHTCNLRKSHGFHLVAQGADPIPGAGDAKDFYKISVEKRDEKITFSVNGLKVFEYVDDGTSFGPPLGGGRIGFRQLAPLKAAYRNLKVYDLCG